MNVLNDRLNCPKVMSGCRTCSDRLHVPQRWPGSGETAVAELVTWPPDHACSTVSRPQWTAASGSYQCWRCWST